MSLSVEEFNLCSSDCVVGAPGGAGVPGVVTPGGFDRAMKSRIVSASAVMASVICSFVAMTTMAHSDKNVTRTTVINAFDVFGTLSDTINVVVPRERGALMLFRRGGRSVTCAPLGLSYCPDHNEVIWQQRRHSFTLAV